MSTENNLMNIVTRFEYPAIPDRGFDWHAFQEGCEEDGQYGYGSTEQEAIDDLLLILSEEE